MAYRSRQRKYGGGKFKSERQRRAMWANSKSAAHKWAHNLSARKDPSWKGMRGRKRTVGGVSKAAGRRALGRSPSRNRGRKS